MITSIIPKLPMRNKAATLHFYTNQLGFKNIAAEDYDGYLILAKDEIEIHFFEFKALNPETNYGQLYIRTNNIDGIYQALLNNKVNMHPNAPLQIKPWGQKEFALLDPDNNLLTFGQNIN